MTNRETPAQPLAANLGLLCNVLENFEPSGIGQRFGDPLELLGLHWLLMLRKPYDL